MRTLVERFLLSLVVGASLAAARPSTAVTMEWVTVGDPGNAGDTVPDAHYGTTGYGAVSYAYQISKYEVTNTQYAEFLNAIAWENDYAGLYNAEMSSTYGGIVQNGSVGSFSYSVKSGFEQKPVNFVSVVDAAYFANWLNNGQPAQSSMDPPLSQIWNGAYNLSDPNTIVRNPSATIFLPSENEWYKAAYYQPSTETSPAGYFLWPTGTNSSPTCTGPTAAPNSANCNDGVAPGDLVPVGSYPGSPSPYGTLDQGGNVWEWTETLYQYQDRVIRGGSFDQGYGDLRSEWRDSAPDSIEIASIGFRVAAIVPEPGTGSLCALGLLGLAARRRSRS
jgi:formylglycine-generating enzyme required for sulfatase activity